MELLEDSSWLLRAPRAAKSAGMEARRQRDVKRGRERGVELIALNFDGRAQRFAASDIGGFMFAPVGLLAA
ncbi:MAG TPA: hypothetical protein VE964_07570, partial [Myxococcales bacterium]|nr:hypothetical protein [Myxococcales bacterium]